MTEGCVGEFIATRAENQIDLVMRRQEPLRLICRLEPPQYLLTFSRLSVRDFDRIVEPLMSSVNCIRGKCTDWLDIAAQFTGHGNSRLAKPCHKTVQKAFCCFRVSTGLNENVQYIPMRIDRALKPMFCATDCDHGFINVPLVTRCWPIPADTIRKMLPETVDQSLTVSRLTMTPRLASRFSTSAMLRATRK